ncbi:MAG: hypothetical protein KF795_00460 [Labilithrix sp.]|nr:hypothetical protein [Labilithrix sp.]
MSFQHPCSLKRIVALILLLLVAESGCKRPLDEAKVRAELEAKVRAEIQAICDAENLALSRRDPEGAFAPYANDWESIDVDGSKRTLADEREDRKDVFFGLKSLRATTTIAEVKLLDGAALVIDRSDGEMEVVSGQTGRTVTIRSAVVAEVWWRRAGSGWLAYRTRVLSRKRWVDGKLVTSWTSNER